MDRDRPLLEIEDLHVAVDDHEILRGVDLRVPAGEVHAVMGPNGSGKSTLAHVIAGRDGYAVTRGRVLFDGRDLLAMEPEERARAGVFLGFQYPVEVPGVGNAYFLRTALNQVRRARGDSRTHSSSCAIVRRRAVSWRSSWASRACFCSSQAE